MTGKKRNKSSAKNSPPSKRVKNINNYDNKEAKQHSGVYECLVCHKRLSSRQVLRDHEAIHTGVKRHKCPHCKKPFTHYVGMWGHKQKCSLRDSPPSKQENNNNELSPIGAVAEPRQCCVCHGGDSSPGHLAEHSTEILTKIGIIDEDDDDETRPTCVVCYRVFESKLKYIKHLMEKHSIIYSFLTAKYLRSTSKVDSRNDDDVGDQGISSFGGYKEDKNFDDINLGGGEEKGRSCGLDVSTQTEESQESAGECPSLVHFLKKSWRNTWSFAAAVLAPRQWISYPTRVWECTHRTLVIQTFRSSVHIFRHPLFQ